MTMTAPNEKRTNLVRAKATGLPLLSVQEVSKTFGGVKALDRCSFEVYTGQITALIGPNGAGKTTVFNVVSGLLNADHGAIQFNGRNINNLSPNRIARLGIGRTFQDNRIFPQMTALENVMLGMRFDGGESLASALARSKAMLREERENREKALAMLARVGLSQKADALAGGLSLGQRKLLEVAKALAAEPVFLMLDEPVAGLFPAMIQEMRRLIIELREAGRTVLFIEHNMNVVMNLADRVIVLNYGRRIAEGTPAEIQNNEEVVQAYLGRRKQHAAES